MGVEIILESWWRLGNVEPPASKSVHNLPWFDGLVIPRCVCRSVAQTMNRLATLVMVVLRLGLWVWGQCYAMIIETDHRIHRVIRELIYVLCHKKSGQPLQVIGFF